MSHSSESRSPESVFRAGDMADLHALMTWVSRACNEAGIDGESAFAVRLAVEEAFTNIMEHGYGGRGGPVSIAFEIDARRVQVVMLDEAAPFDPADAPPADLDAALEDRLPGGLGWHLVHQVMDEVRHQALLKPGNVLTLIKRLPASAPAAQGEGKQ